MKAIIPILCIVAFSLELPVLAREDKNPVAENDFATTTVLQSVEIKVMENDFAYDGHPFKISFVHGGLSGNFQKTDTSIIYTPGYAFPTHPGIDSVLYNIVDLENNLFSDFAKVYIEVSNPGFGLLDINQVSCRINAYGLQFWDMCYTGNVKRYEVPSGSGVSSIFSQSLWVAGIDDKGDLCVAAERYRIAGADFYSGPVMDSSSYSIDQDVKWHRVWKLSSAEVSYHRQHWQDAGYEPVENIALWPGNGDISLGQAEKLAPYYDWNGDGAYDPLNGDFPR